MVQGSVIWGYILAALVLANLPWLLPVKAGTQGRVMAIRLALLVVGAVAAWGLSLVLESRATGSLHEQGWEFYAVGLLIFVTFGLPGFIYRVIIRSR